MFGVENEREHCGWLWTALSVVTRVLQKPLVLLLAIRNNLLTIETALELIRENILEEFSPQNELFTILDSRKVAGAAEELWCALNVKFNRKIVLTTKRLRNYSRKTEIKHQRWKILFSSLQNRRTNTTKVALTFNFPHFREEKPLKIFSY